MANAYSDILSGTSLGANLVKTAYDRLVEMALRPYPMFRQVADKRPAQQAMPGDSVTMQFYQDMAKATGTLTETTDPDAVAVPSTTTVSVTLAEYGNATLATRKLRLFALSDVDPAIADIVAYNMVDSLDSVVRDVLRQGTNVTREAGGSMTFNTGSAVNVTATDVLKSRDIRASVVKLRGRSVIPRAGSSYVCYLNPDVSYDLRSETGADGWRQPHMYEAGGNIWGGTIGEYEGALFIETPRTYSATDGAASAKVHRTVIVGKQALAEAVAEEPHMVMGPVIDKLGRFRPVGWYGVLGWSRYREEAIQRIETSSSF